MTYFALAANTRFDPQLLNLNTRNRLLRPGTVLPLSPASKQRLLEMDDASARIEILRRLIRPDAA